MLKSIAEKFIYSIFRILYKAVSIINKDAAIYILRIILKAFENEDRFLAFYVRPKNISIIPKVIELNTTENFAIVIQGPICKKDDITAEAVKYYKKMYVGCDVILSTWNDESDESVNKIEALGAIIVKNEKPIVSGILNVNFQLTNSLSGIKKAKELGYKYVVKTRTDQLICKPYFFNTMLMSMKHFTTADVNAQNQRIVLLSSDYGNMFTPYFMSDFLYFGQVDDMIKLFSAPLDTRPSFDMNEGATRREYSESVYPPEIYIIKHYLQDYLDFSCDDTIENYWEAIKKYFICYSIKEADVLWRKYESMRELNRLYGEYFRNNDSEDRMITMSFDSMNWLGLYYGVINYRKEYEKYADVPMDLNYDREKIINKKI